MPITRIPPGSAARTTATSATASEVQTDATAAFSSWLTSVLRGSAPEGGLAAGAQLFAAAAHGSTFRQAKVAFAQVAAHLAQHRPELKDAMFVAVQPFLVAKARAEGDAKGAAEIERGVLTFDVEVPDAVLEAANRANDARAKAWLAQTEAQDEAEIAALRAQMLAQASASTTTGAAGNSEARTRGTQSMLAARGAAPFGLAPAARVEAVQAAGGAARASDAQWGAFLGRVMSNVIRDDEGALLDAMAAKGKVDDALVHALTLSGVFAGAPGGEQRIQRIGAAMAVAKRAASTSASGMDATDKAFLDALAKSDATPAPSFTPPMTIKDGDLESILLKWVGVTVPRLKSAVVMNHPHIPKPEQLTGTSTIAKAVASESGRFLEGYNVLTVMHQLGSAPPWLALLEQHLGLQRKDYLGVAVPYSVSQVALDRLNREGWKTVSDHDPREPMAAKMQDLFGAGNPQSFDELKEADIERAVREMIRKSDENGKKIMVIDDGGYVIKVIRKQFPEHEHRFKIVEWTMRGIRQLETVENPKAPVVAAAETAPKTTIEPAFIADSTVLHFLAAVSARLGGIEGKRILVVGAGNIGNAVALALKERGAIVGVHDRDPKKMAALPEGLEPVHEITEGVKGKHAILAATGANALGPDVFSHIDPGTLVTSASSVDIETRDPAAWKNGHWENGLVRATLKGTLAADGTLEVEREDREILGGGFVLNLSRRARIMPIEREELILMNVTEALATAHHTTATGKVKVEKEREERIEQVFAQEHPAEYARALEMRG